MNKRASEQLSLSDQLSESVSIPESMPLDEVARILYPGAMKEDLTPNAVHREWGFLRAECMNSKHDLKLAEERVANGQSPGRYTLEGRRKQLKIAEAVLQRLFNAACKNYFVDDPCTWPAYVMSKDEGATSKDWHFFFRSKPGVYYQCGWGGEETSRAFGEHWDALAPTPRSWLRVYLGIPWHVSVTENASHLSFTAPKDTTYRPSSYEGPQEGAAEWAKREEVHYLKVCAKDVQGILDRFKDAKIRIVR